MRMMKAGQKGWSCLCLCTLLILGLLLAGCGAKEDPEVQVDLQALQKDMFAADTTLPEMTVVSSQDKDADLNFSYLSDMDYGLVDGYFYGYASDGSAPELAVVKAKDSQDVVKLMDALKGHIETRKSTFQQYDPDQVGLVDQAVLVHQGSYVALIVSKKSGLVQQAFEAAFDGSASTGDK